MRPPSARYRRWPGSSGSACRAGPTTTPTTRIMPPGSAASRCRRRPSRISKRAPAAPPGPLIVADVQPRHVLPGSRDRRASRSATRGCGRCACSRCAIAPAERVAIVGLDGGGRGGAGQPGDRRERRRSRGGARAGPRTTPTSPTATSGSPRSIASASSASAPCCSTARRSSRTWRCRSRCRSIRSRPRWRERVAALARECGLTDGQRRWRSERRWRGWPARSRRSCGRARTWRAPSRSTRCCWCSSTRPPTVPEPALAAYAADIVRVTDARRMAALVLTQDQAFAQLVAHRTLTLNAGDRRADAGQARLVQVTA